MPAALAPSIQDLADIRAKPDGAAQPLLGFLSNDDWDTLLAEVNAQVQAMEALPPGQPKDQVFALLDGIDAIHREALHRLVRLFKEGVLEKVVSDPAIHTLMELYDLLPEVAGDPSAKLAEPRAEPRAEPQAEVGKPRFPTIPIRALPSGPPATIRYPHWVPVLGQRDDLASGTFAGDIVADGVALLLARRDERLFALDAQCPVDGAPLQSAWLNGYTLSCPHHPGCHYDLRNGARIGGGAALRCYPVKTDERGRVLVGFDMAFKADVPSF